MNRPSSLSSLLAQSLEWPPGVTLQPLRWGEVSTAEWDAFAARCGGSHQCALDHIMSWRGVCRVQLFAVFRSQEGSLVKIGQCAVACAGRRRWFLDSLQLLPGFDDCWASAMAAVLLALGPGRYRYGSTWNLERRRDGDVEALGGVTVERIDAFMVQAVEFSRWSSWDAYLGAVSANARRNAKRAPFTHPELQVTIHRHPRMIAKVQLLTWMRAMMFRRKALAFHATREWLRALRRAVLWRRHAFIAAAMARNRVLSIFSGIEFGANTYYLEGASQPDNGGAAWFLMLAMLRQAFHRMPQGRFVMGVVDKDPDLNRSREQCRVSLHPASIIEFTYAAPPREADCGPEARRHGAG